MRPHELIWVLYWHFQYTSMKSIGIKTVDETFKVSRWTAIGHVPLFTTHEHSHIGLVLVIWCNVGPILVEI